MNKFTTRIKQMVFLTMAVCLAVSCTEDMENSRSALNNGSTALRISFAAPDYTQVNTRSVMESGIKDMSVLVFKEGRLKKTIQLEGLSFAQAVTVEGIPSLPKGTTDPFTGTFVENGNENIICFLANVKAMTGNWPALISEEEAGNGQGVTTYTEFLNYKPTYESKDALVSTGYIPMYGVYTDGIVDGMTNQINVSLTRALAKINFTVNTDNFRLADGEMPSVVVNGISLHNVPLEVTLPSKKNRPALPVGGLNGVWPDVQQPYPTYAEKGFVSFDANDEKSMSGNTDMATFVAYMPENARGSYDGITNYKDKSNAAKLAEVIGSAEGLTYLLVDLTYTTNSGIMRKVEYTIYLGGNNAGDMNIRANAQYNVTTYIYGDNTEDGAVTNIKVIPLFDPSIVKNEGNEKLVDIAQTPANCYMVDVEDYEGDFYIPLSQVRKGWTYIEKSLNDGKAYVDELDKVIRGGKWELVTLWKTMNHENSNIVGTMPDDSWISPDNAPGMKNYFAKLIFGEGVKNGNNAVIALRATEDGEIFKNGDILWSWHIWLTDYKPAINGIVENGEVHKYEGISFTSGNYRGIMDRNLGAVYSGKITGQLQTTEEAVKLYGLQYQWGRKDPFPASGDGTNTMLTVYDANNETYSFPSPVANDNFENKLKDAVMNPTTFYFKNGGGDWTKQDDNLWTGSDLDVFTPTPASWSLPGTVSGYGALTNAWAGFSDGNFAAANSVSSYDPDIAPFDWQVAVSGQVGTAGRLYLAEDGVVKAWYPAAGHHYSGSGLLQSTGSYGFYWAGATSGANGSSLYFYNSNVGPSNNSPRAYGFSVRCVHK